MANRNEDNEKRWRRIERENDWGGRSRSGVSYNRGYSRQMDDENRWDYPRERGRGFDRQWDDEERSNRSGQGEWNYEGPYYNRGSFNPGWEVDRDYGQEGARDYGYGRDYSSGGDYGYHRDFERSMGRDYGRSSINRSRGEFNDQLDRGWRSRDANLENFSQRAGSRRTGRGWEIEDDWDEEAEPAYVIYEEWWLVPGPFTGVGPRGYQRSDERISEDICERMTQHGQIDASDVEVEVREGEVTLRGTVDSRRTKRMAEDIIDDIPGVNDIHNELRVRQQENRVIDQGREVGRAQEGTTG